jgi:Bacterial antitoxin of type II TA system, VapB
VATNLAIDHNLLREAQIIGHHKTKKETVNRALLEYIQHHKQEKIINLFGTIEYDPKYNYKEGRNR